MGNNKYEAKPAAYPRTNAPTKQPSPKRAEVSLGKTERITAPAKPDRPAPAVTGRYEQDSQQFTLQVNQAGEAVVCWLVDYKTKALTKLEGVFDGGQSFDLNVEFSSANAGRLSDLGGGVLLLDLGRGKELFRKVGNGPTLSDSALLGVPPEAALLARRQEHFPLTSTDRRLIRNRLDDSVIGPMITAWLDAPNDPDVATRFKRGQLAEVIDNQVGRLFSALNPADHPLAEEFAQQVLLAQSLTHDGDQRNLLDWLQEITSRSEAEALGPTGQMEQLEQHLKLSKNPTSTHFYSFTLTVIGPSGDFGVGLGGFLGTLDMNETDATGATVLRPVGTFTLIMGQASLGPSAGVSIGFSTSGKTQSPYVWRAANVPGWFRMLDVGAGVSSPIPLPDFIPGSAFSPTSVMFLHGNGTLPQLIIDFTGFSQQFGAGAGAAISGAGGLIFSAATPGVVPPGTHRFDQDYTSSHRAQDKVHFKFGSALLTEDARSILRILCANELASFDSAGSQLTINSHADRVDTDERNLELSSLRAQNTLQALRDILGTHVMTQDRIALRGLGEQGARDAGDKDHSQNPTRRKSEVVINSRLVVTLFGKQ
jgi:outer membrane protein OmpA-like peptidoglycan-associated protein